MRMVDAVFTVQVFWPTDISNISTNIAEVIFREIIPCANTTNHGSYLLYRVSTRDVLVWRENFSWNLNLPIWTQRIKDNNCSALSSTQRGYNGVHGNIPKPLKGSIMFIYIQRVT